VAELEPPWPFGTKERLTSAGETSEDSTVTAAAVDMEKKNLLLG